MGHRVMETVGRDITDINFSRGFAIELGSTLSVVLASVAGKAHLTTYTRAILSQWKVALKRGARYIVTPIWHDFVWIPLQWKGRKRGNFGQAATGMDESS